MEDARLIEKIETEDSIKEERKWCVYIHRNKHNNKCYIGQTCKKPTRRWGKNGKKYLDRNKDGSYHHPIFARALIKYPDWNNDWEHIIFADNLTQDEANHMEMLLIALYKTNCFKYRNPSFGYNMNDGYANVAGENNPMYGVRRYGKDNPNYGNHKLAGGNNPNYGKVTPQKVRQQISNTLLGKIIKRSHLVYCIELNEIFTGSRDAERKTKIKHEAIVCCCGGKKSKSAGKHPETGEKLHWLYVEDAIKEGYITQQNVDNYLQNIQKGE